MYLIVTNPKNHKQYQLTFLVVDGKHHRLLLGNTEIQAMYLTKVQPQNFIAAVLEPKGGVIWAMETVLKAYGDIFKDDECLEGKLQLDTDPTIEPVCLP